MAPSRRPNRPMKTNPITSIDLDDHAPLDISGPVYDALRPPIMKALNGIKHCMRSSKFTTVQQDLSIPPEMKVFSGNDPFKPFPPSPHSSKASEKDDFTFSSSMAIDTRREIERCKSMSRAALRRRSPRAFRKLLSTVRSKASTSTTSTMPESKRRGYIRLEEPAHHPTSPKPVFPLPSTTKRTAGSSFDCETSSSSDSDEAPTCRTVSATSKPKRCACPRPCEAFRRASRPETARASSSRRPEHIDRPRRRPWAGSPPNCHCGESSELVNFGRGRYYRCAEGACVFRQSAEVMEDRWPDPEREDGEWLRGVVGEMRGMRM